jgi:hypothetical protein
MTEQFLTQIICPIFFVAYLIWLAYRGGMLGRRNPRPGVEVMPAQLNDAGEAGQSKDDEGTGYPVIII